MTTPTPTPVAAALAASNLFRAEALRTILLACRTRGVACVPLRGLALAQQLYGDPTIRPAGDLDLLVRKPELSAVAEIVQALGYRPIDRRRGFAKEFSYTLEFFTTIPVPLMVEPHWSLAYPPFADRLDMEGVWSRCAPGRLLGLDVLSLSAEDCLLNLCLHLVHHGTAAPLMWVDEIDQLVRQQAGRFRWDLFQQTAIQAGVGRLTVRALAQTRAAFETPLPEGLCESLQRARIRRVSLAERVVEQASIAGRESLAMFLALRGWRTRWRYGWMLVCPSAEFMRIHYGLSSRRQIGWWYLRRLVVLGADAARGMWELLIGSLTRRSSSAASASTKS